MLHVANLNGDVLSKASPPKKSSHRTDALNEEHELVNEQFSAPHSTHSSMDSNGSGRLIVMCMVKKDSPLKTALMENLISQDVMLIFVSKFEELLNWVASANSVRKISVIIESSVFPTHILHQINTCVNISLIFLRTSTEELHILKLFAKSCIKISGIYDDDTRLLIKLVIELALLSEEIGDELRDKQYSALESQRNYQRALALCSLARKL